ncbi:hypothetical protein COB64_03590 [Candidatus Wolfebacteria bacterium]|nr:MAG: hypothetical protein COB64_03590 [Candidatus Wolfebacteria bacterium]
METPPRIESDPIRLNVEEQKELLENNLSNLLNNLDSFPEPGTKVFELFEEKLMKDSGYFGRVINNLTSISNASTLAKVLSLGSAFWGVSEGVPDVFSGVESSQYGLTFSGLIELGLGLGVGKLLLNKARKLESKFDRFNKVLQDISEKNLKGNEI